MPTQIGQLGVTFPDTTLQTTAAIPGTPGFGLSVMSIFTNNGFFVVPAGITRVRVTVIGGGGRAGENAQYSGAGGGGGGTAIKTITGLTPGTSINVIVGAGSTIGGQGGSGGTSSFGAFCSATGGTNGYGDAGSYAPIPGFGGAGIGGDLNITGGTGSPQFIWSVARESGTDYFSSASLGGGTYLAPAGSTQYGAGGTLAGEGSKGVVIVEY